MARRRSGEPVQERIREKTRLFTQMHDAVLAPKLAEFMAEESLKRAKA
jgi:hypothetical protein